MLCGVGVISLLLAAQAVDRPGGADGAAIRFGPWPLIPAGILCVLAATVGPREPSRRVPLVMILIAVGMRAPMWLSPIWPGADCQRYLWDGAMVANGLNPYRYSPREVLDGAVDDPVVRRLAVEGVGALEQITFKDLRTMYPPVAQGLFAVAYRIRPFSMTAWRVVLTSMDLLAAAMVLLIGRTRRLPVACALLYLWNPILVWETHMAGHVDLAAAALALAAVFGLLHRRSIGAAILFVVAAGVKLWPLLGLAFVVASAWGRWRRLAGVAVVTILLVAILAALFAPALGPGGGLVAYSRTWAANSGAFRVAYHICREFTDDPDVTVRGILATILGAATIAFALRAGADPTRICECVAAAVILMLLLSPTLYPWYYIAAIGLASVAHLPAAWVWSISITVCYWRVGPWNDPARWALVHLPAWVLLALPVYRAVRRRGHTTITGQEP